MGSRYRVEGNTVRKQSRQDAYAHPVLEEQKKKRRSLHLDVGTIFAVILVGAVMIYVIFYYVDLQSRLTQERREYAALVTQYEELKRANDLYYEKIISSVDMQEIARIAREELGMQVAGEGQIVSYAGSIEDYVKQYADIPVE